PYGACPVCGGIGFKMEFDPELLIDEELSISKGAILPWKGRRTERFYIQRLASVARHYGFSLDTPFKNLPEEMKNILLYGSNESNIEFTYDTKHGFWERTGSFEGIIPYLTRRYEEAESDDYRETLHNYMRLTPCPACGGKRLRAEALAVTIMGRNIAEFSDMPINALRKFVDKISLSEKEQIVVGEVLREIKQRLEFLIEIGVGYLSLSRLASTLSGGESQRIRLATQIGSRLSGVLYVLDEPTVGLHPRDTDRLIETLKELRDGGNTVIVVEHDENTIRHADYIIEMGPGAGKHGGEIVATGDISDIMKAKRSPTGRYLSGKVRIDLPHERRKAKSFLRIKGASQFNLKDIDVDIPLGTFVCLTGVSGSGKSTLLYEIIYKGVRYKLGQSREKPGKFRDILGWENIKRVVVIDQSPIGKTPRSNPATYTGAFTPIRELFASLPESKIRGYKAGRFSFNVPGGRCSACKGEGVIRVQMQFLPDVYVPCDVCGGKRYNSATLEVKYKGKNIADVLEMSVEEALEFFYNYPAIRKKLQLLLDVGLGYIKLGQPATTLSGGEAQRVKLATELSKTSTKSTLYLLDEPTTGLHMSEVSKLISVLQRLVDRGNTVLVIEHNLDVIKVADLIIDLGPEGGEKGGYVVATGTPEEVAHISSSYTGKYLLTKIQDSWGGSWVENT
ncbi:MAG: excinuclease ABC subunit UvrA, partial [Synergistetes bacterium]|nr:excinuclease ABC subunit UvrA [Synergistota bacterium]